MKKFFLLVMVLFVLCSAYSEGGILVGADLDISFAEKPYVSEILAYKYTFKNDFGLSAGLRLTENIIREENEAAIYFMPYVDIFLSSFYLGGGILMSSELSDPSISYMIHTGVSFGDYEWGPGLGCVNIGVEVSPMLYYVASETDDTGDQIGAAIGTGLLTVLNLFKIYAGVTYFLPF